MGSIPVRSTKKRRMQFCIRRFLVFFLVNRPRFVNMACHILAEGLPLAGNGKFPHISTKTIIAILHSVFFGSPSREFVLGSSIRQSRILAEGIPLAGNTQPFSLVECFFLCKAVALFACGRIKARSYAFFFFNTRKIIIIKETIAATQTTAIIA